MMIWQASQDYPELVILWAMKEEQCLVAKQTKNLLKKFHLEEEREVEVEEDGGDDEMESQHMNPYEF
jgi:hypothetical protein